MQKAIIEINSRQRRRGFTLTEIAIVLGIVGLILGAIWVAAAAVYSNLRVAKASTQLLQIAQAVRSMYATSSTVDAAADMPAKFAAATAGKANQTYLSAGVFPSDTLNGPAPITAQTATTAIGPWGNVGALGSISIQAATSGVANDSFRISFDNVPTAACVSLLTSVSGTGRDPGLTLAGAGALSSTTVAGVAVPVIASVARTQCNRAGNSAVTFIFRLKG